MKDRYPVAVVYDFDQALASVGLRSDYAIGGEKVDREAFRKRVDEGMRIDGADAVLTCMRIMLEVAEEEGEEITADWLAARGRELPLQAGLEDGSWFERVDGWAKELGLDVGHYAVSSRIQETVEGCAIGKRFRRILGSRFDYRDGVASWPAAAVNDCTRDNFLFGMIQGTGPEPEIRLKPQGEYDRRKTTTIVVGGTMTDFGLMSRLNLKPVSRVMVYTREPGEELAGREREVRALVKNLVNAVLPADYREGEALDIFLQGALSWVKENRYSYRTPDRDGLVLHV